ncbi:MAG: hypothetical protein EPN97_16655 [Alphaproteobacteria bacterium]|nr:MAG: hypothetical protein EPN97_16655 [Alphaproteobacteria bacterium]
MFKIPKVPKLPVKRAISLASWAFVLGTGLTGVYNFASAKMDENRQAIVMKAAAACEQKLTYKETPCTLEEQKALLARESIERRKWKGGAQAGASILLIMAAF